MPAGRAFLCAWLASGCTGGGAAVPDAVAGGSDPPAVSAARVLPVEADVPVEPSGLAFLDGELLAVSDEQDGVIYRMVLSESSARMEPFLLFQAPEPRPSELDLEGITVCEGRVFLVSETASDVLEVDRSGEARWLGAEVRGHALSRGLLGSPGAGLEGIACADGGGLVVAAEREPRALLWLTLEPPAVVDAEILDLDDAVVLDGASSDFSDLAAEHGRLWALYRYEYEVLEVIGGPGAVALVPVADFADLALDPRYRYSSTRFGTAEGLAIDDEHFYIVADNNDLPRAAAPGDCRPLLFVIPRPRR